MPVIGRLDGQVDEVLIKPLERGREPEPAGDAQPPPPEPTDETPRGETSPPPAELPVWML